MVPREPSQTPAVNDAIASGTATSTRAIPMGYPCYFRSASGILLDHFGGNNRLDAVKESLSTFQGLEVKTRKLLDRNMDTLVTLKLHKRRLEEERRRLEEEERVDRVLWDDSA
jgi:hypothetical protein